MSTATDHDSPTMDQSAGSEHNRRYGTVMPAGLRSCTGRRTAGSRILTAIASDASHVPEQHIADKPVPKGTPDGQAPAKEPSSPPQAEPPAKPIAE